MKRTDPAAGNSQEALALSIARVVQLGLPGPDSPDAIRDSVSEALHSEACENELTLAHIRIVVLLAAGATLLLSAGRPELLGLSSIPASLLVVGTIWLAAAVFLDVALSRGWYRRWLRKAVPLMDALGVTGVFGIILWNLAAEGRLHPIGLVATAALGCASIIVSGVLRLSRSGARFATGSAVAAWIAISFVGRIPVVTSLVVGGLILATGLLVWRSMRSMRGVITNEVSRLRLTRMYQEAQEAIRTREEVLKIVSHDLRNPLSTIAMATNMLIEHPASEDRQARNLAIIKRAGERMNRMIHDLLDAARVESGALPIQPEVVNVQDLLDGVAEIMAPLAEEKSLTLHLPPARSLPRLWADSDRVFQVFSNLIGNAIKFTPEGGSITVRAEGSGGRVRFAVVDTGPGIPEDQLASIFERMWQARTDDSRGIGLGLAIARAIVDAHGERIGVESELGVGTEFWFTLRLAEPHDQSTNQDSSARSSVA